MRIRQAVLMMTCLILIAAGGVRGAGGDRPVPAVQHVLIISVDGMRPDLMLRADTPRLHKLLDDSAYTMWAKTTPASITLPSHVSMLTGVPPEVHGILWNADLPLEHPIYPAVPTLFELAKRAGYTTAMSAGKPKFAIFDKPGALDWKYISDTEQADDTGVVEHAVSMLRDHQPGVLFVHLAGNDVVGHTHGWGSPEQMAQLATTDREIGKLLDTLAEMKLTDSTFIIVSSDHGGAGRTHGPEDVRSRTIPWIASGPGVRKNFDLTRLGKDYDVETYDTFATSCAMLGIDVARRNRGKFIAQILEKQELVMPEKPALMGPSTVPSDSGS